MPKMPVSFPNRLILEKMANAIEDRETAITNCKTQPQFLTGEAKPVKRAADLLVTPHSHPLEGVRGNK